MQPSKGSVVMGFVIMVVLWADLAWDLFQKARAQEWRYFWIDVASLSFMSALLGFVLVDAFNHHCRRRRRAALKGKP